ncbi:MAG: NAD+ synthase [Parachlamydiales bacterium]|nr:NAD+ synthase [Parachlamydiales bacterium]
MRIAIAQLNSTVGDLAGNVKKIIALIALAKKDKAALIVFPELSLTGYPPEDLLESEDFVNDVEKMVLKIAKVCKGIICIFGSVRKRAEKRGKPIANSAIVCKNGQVIGYYDKQLLPTYGIFDERRYFEPGTEPFVFDIDNQTIVLSICEDMWPSFQYPNHPLRDLKKFNPDLHINLSASPFDITKDKKRIKACQDAVRLVGCPLVYCNQVGANDGLIFDGKSAIFDKSGKTTFQLKAFEEDFLITDTSNKAKFIQKDIVVEEELFKALTMAIKDYFKKSSNKIAVIGLSGGIDSALVVCLTAAALGSENVIAVFLPSNHTSKESMRDAALMAKRLNIQTREIHIEKSYQALRKELKRGLNFSVVDENIQSRLRTLMLMAIANENNALQINTGNKSELALGYCTLYGDTTGAFSVIGDLTKRRVYALARWINRHREIIPQYTIDREPSAELKDNQKDTDSLPPYDLLDEIIEMSIEKKSTIAQIVAKTKQTESFIRETLNKIDKQEYKRRQVPFSFRVTEHAFSHGRRFPVVQQWKR